MIYHHNQYKYQKRTLKMMNLDQKIIDKIEADYLQNLPQDCAIQHIPRQQPLHLFSQNQLNDFESLFNPELNFFINIECENIKTQETFDVTEENLFKIKQSPADFNIESLSFDYTSALIFISFHYQDEIQALLDKNFAKPKINTLYFSLALVASFTFIYLFFSLPQDSGNFLSFVIFGIAFLCMAYLYESLKSLLPKQQKKQKTKNTFYIAQYLATHLHDFADTHFKLDNLERPDELT